MPSKLDNAIKALGRYFNVIGKDDFVARLVSDDPEIPFNPFPGGTGGLPAEIPPTLEEQVAGVFLDISEGGLMTPHILAKIAKLGEGLVPPPSAEANESEVSNQHSAEDFQQKLINMVRCYYEDDSSQPIESSFGTPGLMCTQELGPPEKGESYSIREICKQTSINESPLNPSKEHPGISVWQILPQKLTLSSRDNGAVGLFMNVIPTIELSRCVPYIDITLVTPRSPLSEDNRIQTLSISQFLLGQKQVDAGSQRRGAVPNAERLIASAVNADVMATFEDGALAAEIGRKGKKRTRKGRPPPLPAVSSAGMEIFTSPQTLVNAHEDYHDFEPYQTSKSGFSQNTSRLDSEKNREKIRGASGGGTRATGIIDKFRPFLTLGSLSFNVTPTTGMMSHKTAKMSMTLHDRSRLSEVASFVKPDLYGNTEFAN